MTLPLLLLLACRSEDPQDSGGGGGALIWEPVLEDIADGAIVSAWSASAVLLVSTPQPGDHSQPPAGCICAASESIAGAGVVSLIASVPRIAHALADACVP